MPVPTVLIVDDVDGRATFQALQADESTRGIPVVLLTEKLQVGGAQVWDDLDVAGVIAKPFSPMTLGDEVAAMVGWTETGPS